MSHPSPVRLALAAPPEPPPDDDVLDEIAATVEQLQRAGYRDDELTAVERQAVHLWNGGGYRRFRAARAKGIPPALWAAAFDFSAPGPFLDRARQYADEEWPARRSLVLAGPTGVGKSWAAVAALQRIGRGRFLHAPACSRALVNFETQPKAFAQLTRLPFLVLDDLGADYARADGPVDAYWDEVLWHRHARRLPLIITTNLTRDELRARFGDRAWDRLTDHQWSAVFAAPGASYRQRDGAA